MTSSSGEFLLDSSVILAQVFHESRFQSRVEKLQSDVSFHKIDCLASPGVVKETRGKVKFLGEYLTATVKDIYRTMMRHKDPSGTNPDATMTESDVSVIMSYFSNAGKRLGGNRSEETQKEKLDYLETWMIRNIHEELRKTRSVKIAEFFAKCLNEATSLHSKLKFDLEQRISNCTNVTANPDTIGYVKSKLSFLKNDADALNIAEAVKYQKTKNKRIVFVALDYPDLVSSASEIWQGIGLRVADPLYALSVLLNIS